MDGYLKRFPAWNQIVSAYAMSVLMIYSWTFLSFIWKLPSWLEFLHTGEILSILTYCWAVNLAESLIVLGVLLVLVIVLPKAWFRDQFVARSAALLIPLLGYAMVVASDYPTKRYYPDKVLQPAVLVGLGALTILLMHLAGRIPLLRRALDGLANRATILLYIWMPLSMLSIMVILVRSVLG